MRNKLFIVLALCFLTLSLPSKVFATPICGLAKIEIGAGGQNWDTTYCISSPTEAEVTPVSQITATCRRGPVDVVGAQIANCSCHDDDWYDNPLTMAGARLACGLIDGNPLNGYPPAIQSTQTVVNTVIQDSTGDYLSCFTLTSLDRNMGAIDVQFKDAAGNVLCQPDRTVVTPGNYSWLEYYDETLTRLGLNIIPNPVNAASLWCIDNKSIHTAIGCISTDINSGGFLRTILLTSVGIGGGLALILMIYGIFIITTSSGIPDKLKQGQEIISSAIIGLIFIILSIVMMNLIGVQLLGLPGL